MRGSRSQAGKPITRATPLSDGLSGEEVSAVARAVTGVQLHDRHQLPQPNGEKDG